MDLTLKNFKTTLPPELIKKTQKCLVRECDEVRPGHFESYVDELDKTFDVSITFDKSIVIAHQCDCMDSAPICHHKAALLLAIAKGNTPSVKIAKSKKADPILEALEQAELQPLKDWVLKITKKNKDLGLAFLHEFSAKPSGYTPQEIITLTNDAVKAVINKKMKADATEVKKIVEIWSDLHLTVLDSYRAEPTNENYYRLIHAVIETCSFYEERLYTTSKRIAGYLTKITDEVSSVIHTIKDLDAWKKSIGYFVADIFLPDFGFRKSNLDLIVSLFNSSSIDRRTVLVEIMVNLYEDKKTASAHDRNDFLRFVFKLVTANHVFSKYKHLFLPIRHALSYNLALIDLLIAEDDLKSAEAHCLSQIKENTREDFDYEYLSRLKNIYKTTAEDRKLAGILKVLLLHVPDFMDYQFVLLHHPVDPDFKRWRNRVLANARKLTDYDRDAADFSLALLESEENYKGMIDYIDDKIGYEEIIQNATILLEKVPDAFLEKIVNRTDIYSDMNLQSKQPEAIDRLLEDLYTIFEKHYEPEHLKLIIKRRLSIYRGWSNIFVKHLSKKFALS